MITTLIASIVLLVSLIAFFYFVRKPVKTNIDAICLFFIICFGLLSGVVDYHAYIATTDQTDTVTHPANLVNYGR
jgi:uncharacterized membrane protein